MTRQRRGREPLERIAIGRDRGGRWYCTRQQRPGWHCVRGIHLDGPCALIPRWWNLRARWRQRTP